MQDGYHVKRYRGCYCASLYIGGERKGRFTLGTNCKEDAQRQVRDLNAKWQRDKLPAELTVDDVFGLYIADKEAEKKSSVYRMKQCREVIKSDFGGLYPHQIDKNLCKSYIQKRHSLGISNNTIRTELTYLSVALRFGVDEKHIKGPAPRIWRPSPGRPRSRGGDYHLTREQFARLLEGAAGTPHLVLFLRVCLATAGRPSHVLQLTWDRVDFQRNTVDLDDASEPTSKGRALVAMSVKASPYLLRHTAAVWMAEGGVTLEIISQYMGHTNIHITRKHYARYTPGFMKQAANETQVVRGSTGSLEPKKRNVA